MTKLERTKLIDRYLSHEMSEKERLDFERLLSGQDLSYNGRLSLREEMDLQKDIENFIRERGLREMLVREESLLQRKQRGKRIAIWSLGGIVTTAVAALVILLLVVAPVARMMQEYSTAYVARIEMGNLRGGNESADRLDDALVLMQNGKWGDALVIVDNVLRLTADAKDEQTCEMYENAEWLKAVCLMHDGKIIKAKRLLRKIADGESYYKQQASELLERL